ncbi:hypothetical protein IEQ34_000828 [Dendrobium chrysotoxum]|uniref:Uncharacterized protein n=1 Tax=Dendrobium chrysotoxum TaxID=161865 RepID=A0AAV7HA36_DENCH|nr:hypothetical protein IEQ34_000828 [Dendrobium chrysotoxum]
MGSAHEEVAICHYVAPVIMSSEQNQPFNLGENTSKSKVQKEWLEMHSEDAGNDKIEHSLPSIHWQPCPNRKASEAEEMVKYMSSIPSYLQREEEGLYNIQEKVLNVGVLDWRRLQKWTDHEKQLAANKMNNDSPPGSNLSTLYSSPFSSRSNASPTYERKQSSTFSATSSLASSAEKDQRNVRRKDSSKKISKSRDSADIIGSLPSASKGSGSFALLRSNESTKAARLDELEKLQISIEQDGSRSHLNQDGGRPKHRRKHLEEIIARSILSFDAALLDQGNLRRMNSCRLSGNLSLPPRSSAPSSNTHREEPHDACFPPSPKCSRSSTNNTIIGANKNPSFEKGRELLPIVLPRVDLKGISGSPLKSIVHNPPNDAVSRSSSTGRRSPMRLFFDHPRKSTSSVGSISDNPDVAGARSNSRGRRSSVKQILLDPDASVSRSNSRGRRSPLRQMLESPRKSSSTSVHSSQQPQESCGVVDPIHSSLTRKALLKLCWKNGLPLLMFSSSDDSILVAMMHKRSNPDMNICDCVYEIHTAMAVEVKKKNAAWLSQGTKNKKSEFSCKFVAELIVSSSERVSFDLTHRSFIRELVLLGDELFPSLSSNQNRDDASSRTELAAIVVESSHQKSGSPSCGNLCSPCIVAILPSGVHGFSNTREPSKLIEKWESGGACDCGGWDEGCELTILTNNTKQMNSVSIIVQDCGDIIDHGNSGFDLFTEGDARKGKPSFSMVSFKEDMFTVEFKASIPLLQAFAISIAMLHDRNHLISMDNFEDLSFDSYPVISS